MHKKSFESNIKKSHEFTMTMPVPVREIIARIEAHGYEAYAVGGCVRDSLLGRTPDDWDITTSALPQQIKSMFPRTIDTGIQHGTVTILIKRIGYEVTTYRIDGEYEDGRHPKSVEFSSRLVDDLKRRDFTINAMAYNETAHLVDEFDGLGDLSRGIIRCVGDSNARFTEDALRMMRAIRFSAQLGFSIESSTYHSIIKLAPSISKVSMERIQIELVKTLLSDHPDYVIQFVETGLFKEKLPVIHSILTGSHRKTVLACLLASQKNPILRLAALLNFSAPSDARQTLRNLKLDNRTVDTVTKLVTCSKTVINETEPDVRLALHIYGRDFLPLLYDHHEATAHATEQVTGIALTSQKKHLSILRRMTADILERGDCVSIKDLDITGNDLMEYGLSGPKIGETLHSLLQMVIENPRLNDKATLIALIEHL